MWQLPMRSRKQAEARHTRARRRRWYRPQCRILEDRCLLSVSLSHVGPSNPLVGSPVTWTATASGLGTTPVYQFSVEPIGGTYQMVQDFSTSNSFTWDPLQQGSYNIQVIAKTSYTAATGESAVASYTANSRVVGTSDVISPTSNPLVALYSVAPSDASSVYVQFSPLGATPSWQSTSQEPIVPGESTNILVAGMLPNTTYMMRHVLSDGTTSTPITFTTGSLPTNLTFPTFTQPQPATPSSDPTQTMVFHMGVGAATGVVDTLATDLAGNVVWYYDPVANNFPGFAQSVVPGGTVLMLGGKQISAAGGYDTVREVDFAGDTVRETNINAINAELAARGDASIFNFNHEASRLPNGDTAVLAGSSRVINVNGTPTTYNGDMVVVLDKNFQVAWVWDAFQWLSTSRLPTLGEGPTDWLHANAISYSPADGNLIVSLRSQDWVIKINYANGSGDGHVIWRLGQGGDFTLNAPPGTVSPWFSHQHNASYINDTTIVLFDDGNVRRATNSTADSRGQEWVLNETTMTATLVVNADLGNYSLALGSAQILPNGNFAFTSGFLGAPNYFGQTIEVTPNGTKTFVQQMTGLEEYRSYLMSTLYGTPANILDPGFEAPILPAQGFRYDPPGSTWSFSGTAGVSANNTTAFTSGNPNAPQGNQVALLQKTGTASQSVYFSLPGTYQISFSAAQRGNYITSKEIVQVLVDGTVVGTITPTGTSYATYTTGLFSVTAGYHTITFAGIDPTGAGYTAFIDQVNISNALMPAVSDPDFESPNLGTGSSAFAYRPAGSPWSFSGTAGVAGNGTTAFTSGNPNAPQGSQVAFLQKTGSMSQVVNFAAAGSYIISASAAQRGNYITSHETVEVLVDGTAVGTFTPTGTTYATYLTNAFNVTAGNHTISFVGIDPTGAGYTAFLDQVSINVASPTGFANPSFETPNLGTGSSAWSYHTVGATWLFTGTAGVSGNGTSAFTSGNPNAPDGNQVALLQKTGTTSQVVNTAAGYYAISFSAAQRGNYIASHETVDVEVDGTVVGTFTPGSTSYATFVTASFQLAAGAHTIAFVGIDPTGADYTVFLDQTDLLQIE